MYSYKTSSSFKKLSENSKEKKIVIRNNYKPCEKTDRVMTMDEKDEAEDKQTNKPTAVKPEISTSLPFNMPIMDVISDRTSSSSSTSERAISSSSSNKSKSKKNKTKSKDGKDKQKLLTNSLTSTNGIAIPLEPILKSLSQVNQLGGVNQLGYSYPVYIPENPLADYVKQRIIEHPIIYQIEESHDYPLFLSQFNLQPTSAAAYQLKSTQPLAYSGMMNSNANLNSFLPDYAYINNHYQNLHHQYQQAQLLNTLLPQLIHSSINKKPINLIAGIVQSLY